MCRRIAADNLRSERDYEREEALKNSSAACSSNFPQMQYFHTSIKRKKMRETKKLSVHGRLLSRWREVKPT